MATFNSEQRTVNRATANFDAGGMCSVFGVECAETGKIRGGRCHARTGLSLIELLMAIAILGIIMAGLFQSLSVASSSSRECAGLQDLLGQGNYALARMVMFVRETSKISVPAGDKLEVVERVADSYDNITKAYLPDGDGIPDADNDANGLIDDNKDIDPVETVKYEAKNGLITEEFPNYGTAAFGDFLAPREICGNVTELKIKKLADNLVEIKLVLDAGQNRVELFTRAKARIIVL